MQIPWTVDGVVTLTNGDVTMTIINSSWSCRRGGGEQNFAVVQLQSIRANL